MSDESRQARWHKQVSAPSHEAWDGPADVPWTSRILPPFAGTLISFWALLSSPNFFPRSHLLVLRHYERRSRQALLIELVTAPSALQGSGGRHGVFTRVLLTHSSNPQLTSWDNNSSGRIPSVTALYTGESMGKQNRAVPLDALLIGWQENANGGSAQKNIKQNKHCTKKSELKMIEGMGFLWKLKTNKKGSCMVCLIIDINKKAGLQKLSRKWGVVGCDARKYMCVWVCVSWQLYAG